MCDITGPNQLLFNTAQRMAGCGFYLAWQIQQCFLQNIHPSDRTRMRKGWVCPVWLKRPVSHYAWLGFTGSEK